MGKVLKTLILAASSANPASALIRDRKVPGRGTVRHCLVGTEMVDWLLSLSPEVHSRAQASAMWQVKPTIPECRTARRLSLECEPRKKYRILFLQKIPIFAQLRFVYLNDYNIRKCIRRL